MTQLLALVGDIFGLTAALAALSTLVVACVWKNGLPAVCATGFFAGYLALPRSWAALIPQQEYQYQWLPYLGVAAAGVALLGRCIRTRRPWTRWLICLACVLLSGILLTPSWPVLGVTKPLSNVLAMGYLLLVAASLLTLPQRLATGHFAALLALAAAAGALAIGAVISVRLAQLSAIAAGSFAGAWLAGVGRGKAGAEWDELIPVFVALAGGIALISCVEPEKPAWPLLAPPLFPLIAWLGVFWPPQRRYPSPPAGT